MKRYGFPPPPPVAAASVGVTAIAVVFAIAVLDLVGWLLGIPLLKGVDPQFTPMKVVTAICFLMSAAALACLRGNKQVRWKLRLSRLFGAATGVAGLLTATSYLYEIATGHQWSWVNNPLLQLFLAPSPRMALITAILFSLFGCVLLLIGTGNRRASGVGHVVLLFVSMMSYLVIIGYLFDIKELYTWRNVGVAINTSIAFCGLCVAAYCVRPDTWFMHVFTSEGAGADMARRLLPFLLLLPLAIGWLRLHGERRGIFGSEVGVAIVVVTYTVCFLLLLWLNARSVNRTDVLRRKAEKNALINDKMLNRAQEIAHLGSWELDLADNRLFWSDEVYRIFGLKPQEFEATYEAFLGVVHPDDRAAVDTAYSKSVRDGRDTYEIEHRIVQKSTGEIRIVHEKCEHLRDKTGKIIRSTGMVHDITERRKNEDAVLHAKQEWERTFDSVPDLIAIMDCDHRIQKVNKAMAARLGRTSAECNGMHCYREVHGTDEPPAYCPHSLMLADGHEHVAEINENALGGTFLVSTTPIIDTEGRMSGSVHVARDITELKKKEKELNRLNRTLKAISDGGHALSHAQSEHEYLNEACRIIVEDCGHRMVWIGFTGGAAEKTIQPVACAGFEEGYLDTINMTWADIEHDCSPTGRAIRTEKPAICGNVLIDPEFAPWREESMKRGYASCIALPLVAGNKVFGALSIYSSDIDAFLPDEVNLLVDLTGDLANGIEMIRLQSARTKVEELLLEERKFTDAVIQTTGGLITGLDTQGRIIIFNTACEKTTGYTFDEVKDKPFWDFLLVPEEVEPVKAVFRNLAAGSFPNEFENYWIARDGCRRFIRWTNSAILDDDGNVELVIGTGIDITERKDAEEELKKAKNELEKRVRERTADLQKTMETLETERQQFNDVLNMLPAYIILLTPDYYVPFANRFFTERFGQSGGKRCFEYLFGLTEPCKTCESFKPFTTHAPHHWEWTGPDNRNYDIYDFPFNDVDGSPLVLEMGIDITERKRAEESAHQLVAIVESSDDAIVGKSLDGTITSWNHAAQRIYGYRADEMIGKPISLLVPPDRPNEVPEILGKIRRGERVAHYETVRVSKDGHHIAVSMAVSPINDSAGTIIGASTIARDITQHKQMEDELRSASLYSRSLIEASLDPLVTISPEGHITDVNVATERATGCSRQQLIGTDFSDYFTEPERARSGYREVLEKGYVRDYPLTIRCSTEDTIDVLYNATVYRNEVGTVQGVFAAARDVTERKRIEAQLMEANEMKLLGQLTSGVAHEVRNPLNGILAIMGALSKDLSDNDRFQPYMHHMRTQVTRLTVLMEDLLAMGRPLREESLNEISMETLVEKTVATWFQTLQSSKPSVRFIKPENQEECLIRADGTAMTQVIINLLENAFNHSPEGAEIVCSVHNSSHNRVVFSVKDGGTGIPGEILPKIFDPFFTTRKGGTGLGLSIVRRIVDNHHGTIIAYNNSDGPGATFEVELPLHIR